jgi:hypothetical protein
MTPLPPYRKCQAAHQVLIPGPELRGVRGTGGCAFSPEVGLAHLKNGIGYIDNSGSHMFLVDVAAAGVDQLVVAPVLATWHIRSKICYYTTQRISVSIT